MAIPTARLEHLVRPTLEDLVNHKIRQVALGNRQIIQVAGSLGNLLRHHLPLVLPSQPNLALARVIIVAGSLAQNLQQVAGSLGRATLLQRHNKVVASSVLQEEQLVVSVQELALDLDSVQVEAFLVAIINSNSNSRSRSRSVGPLPPLVVLGRAVLGSEPTTILQTTPAVYSAILAKITLLSGKLSSSQLNKTHSAALGIKIKTRPILNQRLGVLVPSSNKSRSQADYLAIRIQITLGQVGSLGT